MPKDKNKVCKTCGTWERGVSGLDGRCVCVFSLLIGKPVMGVIMSDSPNLTTTREGYCSNWTSRAIDAEPKELLLTIPCDTCKSMCKQNVTDCLRYRADKICSHCDCVWWKKDKCAAPAKTPLAFPSSDCGKWQLKQEMQLTIPCENSKLLCVHDRTTIRESLAKIMLSLTEYYTEPPGLECKRNLHDDLLGEIGKIQELL